MTEETQVAPAAETQNTAVESTEQPAVVEPGSTEGEAQESNPTDEAKAEKTPEQKELERLRRTLTKRDRTQGKLHMELEALREQVARISPQEQAEDKPVDPYQLAREIATVERVTERANSVAEQGKKTFPDFADALSVLREEAGDLFTKKGLPTLLGEAILDADDPAALIHYLGTNPDAAAELQGLSPTALGRKVARIEAQMNPPARPKPLSKASEPIAPIKGTANAASKALADMSQAEYEAARGKQGARWAR